MIIIRRRIRRIKPFIIEPFKYRTVNNKLKKLYERCLLTVCNDKKSSLKELLEIDKSVPIHISNLQVLATKMFKAYRNISPLNVRQLFQ